jgi:hypothetical protein
MIFAKNLAALINIYLPDFRATLIPIDIGASVAVFQ